MREIWQDTEQWRQAGVDCALATVISGKGSALRPPGSKMAISAAGAISGSVTGGCVEGAVFEEAQAVLKGEPPRIASYGVSNAQAWEVGLTCGGSIQVFIESMHTPAWDAVLPALRVCLNNKHAATLASVVSGPGLGNKLLFLQNGDMLGDLGGSEINQACRAGLGQDWPQRLANPNPHLLDLKSPQGEVSVFIDPLLPPARLVIIGAAHIAIPLVTLAHTLNFSTIVLDARSAFATPERFPHVDQLIVDWPANALRQLQPDAATCVVCLSHDEKLDNPALQVALDSPAAYIGALGSRVTHARRIEALREAGVSEAQLSRIHAPIGLDLGARQPEEIALSIMAEIVAVQHGKM